MMWRRDSVGRLLLVVAGLGLAVPACPQGAPDPVEELRSTLRGELAARDLSLQGVRIGKSTLSDVEAKLGDARRFSPGGIAELVALCYASSDEGSDTAVVFEADSADPAGVVMMAHVTTRGALGGTVRHCSTSPALATEVQTDGGLALGLSRAAYRARFQQAPSEEGARYTGFYFFQVVAPRAAGVRGSCQLQSGLRGRFTSGRLTAFTVYRFYRGPAC